MGVHCLKHDLYIVSYTNPKTMQKNILSLVPIVEDSITSQLPKTFLQRSMDGTEKMYITSPLSARKLKLAQNMGRIFLVHRFNKEWLQSGSELRDSSRVTRGISASFNCCSVHHRQKLLEK